MDPTGLWATVGLGYQAQFGDTLWGLSELLFGNGICWEDLGYPYDIKKRPLQVGDIISYDGGLVTIENGVVGITASYLLYNPDGTRHIPQTMPDPPRQDPPKNPSSGAPSNPTPTKPNPDSVSSTAGPGNSGSSSGREHIGGRNSGRKEHIGGSNSGEIIKKPVVNKPKGKTNQDIWNSDSKLAPLLKDFGVNLSVEEPVSVYKSPKKIETWLGYAFEITVSVALVSGTGPLTIGTDSNLKNIKSIKAKFENFSAIFDTDYSFFQVTNAINDEWAVSLGYKWAWFTSYYYIAVAYSPKNTTFAVTYTLYVKKQDWKHLLMKGIIVAAIICSPAILSALSTATAGTAAASLVPIFEQYAFS